VYDFIVKNSFKCLEKVLNYFYFLFFKFKLNPIFNYPKLNEK